MSNFGGSSLRLGAAECDQISLAVQTPSLFLARLWKQAIGKETIDLQLLMFTVVSCL
jgi:hypothetical protein